MSAHRIEGVGSAYQNPLPALLSKLVFTQVGSEQDTDVVLAFILYMKNVGDWIRIITLEVLNNAKSISEGPRDIGRVDSMPQGSSNEGKSKGL